MYKNYVLLGLLLIYLSKVDWCHAEYYLMYHPNVATQYFDMKSRFTGEDPFIYYTQEERKIICDLYLSPTVPIFIYTDGESTDSQILSRLIPPLTDPSVLNYQSVRTIGGYPTDDLEYQERTVNIDFIQTRLKMFPCLIWMNTEVHLTYGLEPDTLFMIARLPLNDALLMFMERGTQVDISFTQNRSQFSQYFWTYIYRDYVAMVPGTSLSTVVPEYMTLCTITEHEHVRLCSSVAESLRQYPIFELRIRKVNLIQTILYRCIVKVILNDQCNISARAAVLPCAINKEWNEAQFFLLRDPLSRSLFVLQPIVDSILGEVLRPEAIVMALWLRDS